MATNPNLSALIVGLIFLQVLFVCMVYGPIAAYLVEAFPAKDALHVVIAALSHR